MGAYCIYYTHTYAVAFPLLRQLLCQSGELITGKQICLGSPHRTHTNTNKHTHTHTSLLLISQASLPSIRAPGAWSCLPATQTPLGAGSPEGRHRGWGTSQRLSPCCPGAPAFSPAAASQANQSTYGNSHTPPDREDNTLCRRRWHQHTDLCTHDICTHIHKKRNAWDETNECRNADDSARQSLPPVNTTLMCWLSGGWMAAVWSIPHDEDETTKINKDKQANTNSENNSDVHIRTIENSHLKEFSNLIHHFGHCSPVHDTERAELDAECL